MFIVSVISFFFFYFNFTYAYSDFHSQSTMTKQNEIVPIFVFFYISVLSLCVLSCFSHLFHSETVWLYSWSDSQHGTSRKAEHKKKNQKEKKIFDSGCFDSQKFEFNFIDFILFRLISIVASLDKWWKFEWEKHREILQQSGIKKQHTHTHYATTGFITEVCVFFFCFSSLLSIFYRIYGICIYGNVCW